MKIKELKIGDFFTLTEKENAKIYVRGEYERISKKYSVTKWEDINDETFMKGDRKIYPI